MMLNVHKNISFTMGDKSHLKLSPRLFDLCTLQVTGTHGLLKYHGTP